MKSHVVVQIVWHVLKRNYSLLIVFFEAKKYVVGLGDKFSISGFMPIEDVSRFESF